MNMKKLDFYLLVWYNIGKIIKKDLEKNEYEKKLDIYHSIWYNISKEWGKFQHSFWQVNLDNMWFEIPQVFFGSIPSIISFK